MLLDHALDQSSLEQANVKFLCNSSFSDLPPAKDAGAKQPKNAPRTQVIFKDKREAMEAFKELLREKNVPSSANW